MAQQNALQDQNRIPTALLQQGSTGTANTGTLTMMASGNPTTGAQYVETIGGALITEKFTSVTATYPDGTTEVYSYANGTTAIGTLTVTYTDATKGSLSAAVRT